jgi:hypothetical protein
LDNFGKPLKDEALDHVYADGVGTAYPVPTILKVVADVVPPDDRVVNDRFNVLLCLDDSHTWVPPEKYDPSKKGFWYLVTIVILCLKGPSQAVLSKRAG